MRFFLLLFFICLFYLAPALHAIPHSILPSEGPSLSLSEQIEKLDRLIHATEQSLKDEKKVKELVTAYKKYEEQFLQQPSNNDVLLRMVRHAAKTLEAIKEAHLAHIFDPAFIEELTVLSQSASKRGIPKP